MILQTLHRLKGAETSGSPAIPVVEMNQCPNSSLEGMIDSQLTRLGRPCSYHI